MGANDASRRPIGRDPIRPERVRSIDGQGFAFIPNRFLRAGFFVSLTPDEQRLYVLLVLAGDRRGLSFYHYDSLCSLLEVPLETYVEARNALIEKNLIAYDGTRFQVLSLPATPVPRAPPPVETDHNQERDDPAALDIRRAILAQLHRPNH